MSGYLVSVHSSAVASYGAGVLPTLKASVQPAVQEFGPSGPSRTRNVHLRLASPRGLREASVARHGQRQLERRPSTHALGLVAVAVIGVVEKGLILDLGWLYCLSVRPVSA